MKAKKKKRKEGIEKIVQRLLRDAGYSQDAHVHLLNEVFLNSLVDERAVRSLIALRAYLFSLDPLSRRLCIMEFLEPGRYYRFWYYPFLSDDDFYALKKRIGRETRKVLEMSA